MTRAGLVLAVALLAGCEGKVDVAQRPSSGTLRQLCDELRSVGYAAWENTCRNETFLTDQELAGRVIVMTARGWETWPERITWEGSTTPVTIMMGAMKPNTRYRVTVQEIGD